MGSPQATVRACGGGGRAAGGGDGGGGGELADSPSTHSSGRGPPVKFGRTRMLSRLPRGLIDSYAMSAASSFVELLRGDVDENQEMLLLKKCDSIYRLLTIYSTYRRDVKGVMNPNQGNFTHLKCKKPCVWKTALCDVTQGPDTSLTPKRSVSYSLKA